ncbi:uncharacterized protein PV09_06830 [Verruconis gallopava]|uniref:RRM domain-containing protein n=1 Tax=Verruconis gallopava TaxID=253628 RepID=A0A0D2AR21_9PEZI|nr:uncharacterized protein PV09_06830 [Verruconis gallopava]KIW01644.1 hypothetical protein PV09_06830 [Verruconis gallopava]
MGPHRKKQKISEDGTAVVTDSALSHPKTTDSNERGAISPSTLFIRGLSADTTHESLTNHFSQSYPVKHAVVVTDKDSGKCKGYGFVTFADREDAQRALEEFNGTEFSGHKLKIDFAERRKREDVDPSEGARPHKEEREAPLPSKLIVRNLPWSVDTPEKLTRLFLSFGKVNQAIVPKDNHGRMKGFGIVMLRGRKNAEHALEKVNGKEVDGRILAVDWAADKETWQKAQAQARATSTEELKKEAVEDERIDSGQSEHEDVEEEESSSDNLDGDDDESGDSNHGADDADEDVGSENESEDDSVRKPKSTGNESVLFIRNLPFTTTDDDLYEHFGEIAPVRYARIVIDKETERPRGTGFVCFYKKSDADACLKEAPRVAKPPNSKEKKSLAATSGPSILENELADPTGKYTMNGRVLHITRAVDKNEADRLAAEGTASRNKRDRDKRRLFLLGEGTIPSNSPLYQKLSASERAMRDASAKQRRKLIETNPSLHLSLTRLSVRNIPRSVTSQELKNLARKAVVGFATDVKEGRRQPLSKEELARDSEEMRKADKERKLKKKGIVKQAKIIFEGKDGSKVEEGSGRSRGYGFIEYYTHRSALMGLRWLNGYSIEYQAKETQKKSKSKPTKEDIQDRKKRLIVEFAIENAQVIKRRKEKEIKSREHSKKQGTGATEQVVVQELNRPAGKKRKRDASTSSIPDDERKRDHDHSSGRSGKDDISKSKQRKIIAKKRRARKIQRRMSKA